MSTIALWSDLPRKELHAVDKCPSRDADMDSAKPLERPFRGRLVAYLVAKCVTYRSRALGV